MVISLEPNIIFQVLKCWQSSIVFHRYVEVQDISGFECVEHSCIFVVESSRRQALLGLRHQHDYAWARRRLRLQISNNFNCRQFYVAMSLGGNICRPYFAIGVPTGTIADPLNAPQAKRKYPL
jgi:hypothetical protein